MNTNSDNKKLVSFPVSAAKSPPKLLDLMRAKIRVARMSYITEKNYIHWIKRFILFNNKLHPKDIGANEITEFLSYLAVKKNVAASTQNQALNAIVYLYKQVLERDPRKRSKRRIRTCLSPLCA